MSSPSSMGVFSTKKVGRINLSLFHFSSSFYLSSYGEHHQPQEQETNNSSKTVSQSPIMF